MNGKLHQHTIVTKITIDAGHRLHNHEGQCKHLHGHRYEFEFHARSNELDAVGRVIDFSEVKDLVGGWLNEYWDHGILLWKDDPIAVHWMIIDSPSRLTAPRQVGIFSSQKNYLLPCNPTAENLASYMLNKSNELLQSTGVKVVKVGVWETAKNYAEASL